MSLKQPRGLVATLAVLIAIAFGMVLRVKLRFDNDMQRAFAHVAQGSVMRPARCGPIDYQEAGTGVPLLAVHGIGGGHDQGMAFAAGLASRGIRGIRVFAMSRFGYQRTSMPPWVEAVMMRLIASDCRFWSGLHLACGEVIKAVLATPPELLAHASPRERARIRALLDNILPVSLRAAGLRSDTAVGKHLTPFPLASIHVPTLIISARDDRCGTSASAQYTASHMAGAKFIGFDQGGHTWVGHDDQVRSAIIDLLLPPARA